MPPHRQSIAAAAMSNAVLNRCHVRIACTYGSPLIGAIRKMKKGGYLYVSPRWLVVMLSMLYSAPPCT